MNCFFDPCKLINDLGLGLISSFIASAITAFFIFAYTKRKHKKMFSKADGYFDGFSPLKENPRKLADKPASQAEISYERENRLRIKVIHDNGEKTWMGLITMENEHHGTIAWEYLNLPNGEVEFGFKSCIVSGNGDKVLLIPPAPSRDKGEIEYGREILIRKATNP
jgi:hypothetical protein